MLEEGGERAVNLREAARRAGVSSGAPFRHFEDKQALLIAVAEEVAQRLDEAMRRAGADHDDPLDRFRAIGIEYVVWAVERPALFSLLHSPEHHRDGRSHRIAMLENDQREVLESLISGAHAPEAVDDAPQIILLAAHSLVFGLAGLLIDGTSTTTPVTPATARMLATAVTGVLGRGLLAARES